MFQTQEAMQLILFAIVEEIKTNTHTHTHPSGPPRQRDRVVDILFILLGSAGHDESVQRGRRVYKNKILDRRF